MRGAASSVALLDSKTGSEAIIRDLSAQKPEMLRYNSRAISAAVEWLDNWSNWTIARGTGINPSIAFHFANWSVVNSVAVAVDNSGWGGVAAPTRLIINGLTYTPTVTSFGATSEWLSISGLSLAGNTLVLQPIENPQRWTFVSEVTFVGEVIAVPEPEACAMMLAGLGLLGVAARRKEQKSTA